MYHNDIFDVSWFWSYAVVWQRWHAGHVDASGCNHETFAAISLDLRCAIPRDGNIPDQRRRIQEASVKFKPINIISSLDWYICIHRAPTCFDKKLLVKTIKIDRTSALSLRWWASIQFLRVALLLLVGQRCNFIESLCNSSDSLGEIHGFKVGVVWDPLICGLQVFKD